MVFNIGVLHLEAVTKYASAVVTNVMVPNVVHVVEHRVTRRDGTY